MKKITAYLVALLCMVAFAACSSGSGEGGPDYNSPDYGQLTITHKMKKFENSPSFTPAMQITGTISWSDGESEEWTDGATHNYSGSAPYKATYDLWKAQTVTISNITDLTEIDFSQF